MTRANHPDPVPFHPAHAPLDRRLIVVADGGSARFLAISPDHTSLMVRQTITSGDIHLKTHDLMTDKLGRSFESASPTRHGIAPRHDPHEMAKEHFVQALAERLNQDRQAGLFDELIIAVAPSQAATLRHALDAATSACVVEVLVKDLTKTTASDIWDRLIEARLMPPRSRIPVSLERHPAGR